MKVSIEQGDVHQIADLVADHLMQRFLGTIVAAEAAERQRLERAARVVVTQPATEEEKTPTVGNRYRPYQRRRYRKRMSAVGVQGMRRGATHPFAKLDEQKVREIRALRRAGERVEEIANTYGVSRNTVYAIENRTTWAHVSDEA